MSDYDQFLAMLVRAGVVFVTDKDKVKVEAQGRKHPTTQGYAGFYAEFEFDEAGQLKLIGVWE